MGFIDVVDLLFRGSISFVIICLSIVAVFSIVDEFKGINKYKRQIKKELKKKKKLLRYYYGEVSRGLINTYPISMHDEKLMKKLGLEIASLKERIITLNTKLINKEY